MTGKASALPGGEEFLPEMGKDFRLVVTTGDEKRSARNLLSGFGLLSNFEDVFGDLYTPLGKPYGRILQQLGGNAECSLAIGDRLRADLPADTDKVVTVPNGIPLEADLQAAQSLRDTAKVGADTPVVGYVGRLSPGKGLEMLLEATALLVRRWPDLRLFILGDGPGVNGYVKGLEKMTARLGLGRNVRFFGYVDGAATACAAFDAQVVCSRAEPFGLVTVEAMAQGRPVVVTDSGGSPEIVRDGIEGFLVAPDDAATLARRLDCLLDSPGLRREMGRRGRERVRRRFTLDHMLDATEALYMKVLGLEVLKERRATA